MRKEISVTNYKSMKKIGYTKSANEKKEDFYDSARILILGAIGLFFALKMSKKKPNTSGGDTPSNNNPTE